MPDDPEAATALAASAPRSPLLRRSLPWLLLAVTLLYVAGLNEHWRFQRDSAVYMGLARSLAEQGTYEFGAGLVWLAPPGFPLMLAPIHAAFGGSFLAMNALVSALGVGAVALGWALYRRLGLSDHQLLCCTLLFGLSRTLYYYSSHIMTDVPFLFFVLLGLYAGQRMLEAEGRAGWLWCSAAAAAACAACFVRALGPAVIVGLLAGLWLRREGWRRWRRSLGRTAVLLGPAFAAVALWLAAEALTGRSFGGGWYQWLLEHADVAALARRAARGLEPAVEELSDALLGVGLGIEISVALAVLTATGCVIALARGERLLSCFALAALGAICLASPGRRYLLTALPALVYWLVLGVSGIGRGLMALSRRVPRLPLIAFGYLLLAVALTADLYRIGQLIREARAPDFYAVIEEGRLVDYFALFGWLERNAGPDARIVAYEGSMIHYFTRFPTGRYPGRARSRRMARNVRRLRERHGGSYLILDDHKREPGKWLDRAIESAPEAFERLTRIGALEVIRIRPEPAGEAQ